MQIKTVKELRNLAKTEGLTETKIQEIVQRIENTKVRKFFNSKFVLVCKKGCLLAFIGSFILGIVQAIGDYGLNPETEQLIAVIMVALCCNGLFLFIIEDWLNRRNYLIERELQLITDNPELCANVIKYKKFSEAEAYRQSVLKQGRALRVFDHEVMAEIFKVYESNERAEIQRNNCIEAHS